MAKGKAGLNYATGKWGPFALPLVFWKRRGVAKVGSLHFRSVLIASPANPVCAECVCIRIFVVRFVSFIFSPDKLPEGTEANYA